MFEGMMAGGVAAGGQLTTTTEVENYPGFPDGIDGPELMLRFRQQSLNCGTRIRTETVDAVDLSKRPFEIRVGSKTYLTQSLIIATGATAKRLHIPGEEKLWQKGISACAVCDGALPLFRNQPLAVIGGGDSAVEEAMYLTKFASVVHLLVRRDVLRASKVMQERLLAEEKITVHWRTEALEVQGDQYVTGLHLINNQTHEKSELAVRGLFYAVGHQPNTEFLDGQLETDETGYLITQSGSTKTNIPGVFACGDVQDRIYRQAVTAAGSGCMAALDTEHYLQQ